MIMGQTGKDSILFRGNIVYDGDASEATFLYHIVSAIPISNDNGANRERLHSFPWEHCI